MMPFTFTERASDSPLVEKIWYTQSEHGGSFISTAVSQWEIVVTKQNGKTSVTLRGPETKAQTAPIPENAEFLGITFKLGSFIPDLPTSKLVNNAINLPKVGHHSFWLNNSAWQLPDFENADTFINRLIQEGLLVYEPIVEAVLQGQPQDISLRSLQRRFVQATGLTQATIRQIERASQAAKLLQQGVSILDTVFKLGYTDQPHLTKSLKQYIGQTPAQIIRVN